MIAMLIACDQGRTSVKVNKTLGRYELLAEYPEKKEKLVQEYLKMAFKKDSSLLKEGIDLGKEIKLSNRAIFYLRHNSGKLEIEMLKEKNNFKGNQFFDEIVGGIKKVLE